MLSTRRLAVDGGKKDMKREDLTAGEQRYLEHARAAESQGVSLLQYYRTSGLSVHTLYNVRQGLIRKGVLKRSRARKRAKKSDAFVAVRVAAGSTGTSGSTCQLRHPSGWVIECGSLPDTRWLSALMSGESV
jgi:hypothetical protein